MRDCIEEILTGFSIGYVIILPGGDLMLWKSAALVMSYIEPLRIQLRYQACPSVPYMNSKG